MMGKPTLRAPSPPRRPRRAWAILAITSAVVATALAGGCFRKGGHTKTVLAAAETTGPLPFALNLPLVPVRSEPVALSWSPSTGATAYEARVGASADCADAVYQQLGVVGTSIAVPDLPEGDWHFCVTAKDDAGQARAADNDDGAISVDRTPPVAALAAPPTKVLGDTSLAVTGADVVAFVFKAGASTDVDCADEAGFGNALPAQAGLELHVAGALAEWTLCLLGEDAAGNRQSIDAVSTYRFQADGTGRRFDFGLAAVLGLGDLVGGDTLRLTGRAPADWDGPRDVVVSVRDATAGGCLDDARASFGWGCPAFVPVVGDAAWRLDVAASLLTEGHSYEVAARATDADTGAKLDAGTARFHWRFGTVAAGGDDTTRFRHAVKDAAGRLTMAGTVGDELSWHVTRRRDDGATLWTRRFARTGAAPTTDEGPRHVAVDATGDVYVVGAFTGKLTVDAAVASKGSTDGLLVKLDGRTGQPLWRVALATSGLDEAAAIQLDAQGRPYVGSTRCTTGGACDLIVTRYAPTDGAVAWTKTLSATDDARLTSLAASEDGLAVGGWHTGTLTVGASTLTAAARDGFVAKLGTDGTPAWATAAQGAGTQVVTGVAFADGGDVLAAGHAIGSSSAIGAESLGATDGAVALFTARLAGADGSTAWAAATLTDGTASTGLDLVADASGRPYLTATLVGTATVGSDEYGQSGATNLLVIAIDADGGAPTLARVFATEGGPLRAAFAHDGELVLANGRTLVRHRP
jgi:hypothetical protein